VYVTLDGVRSRPVTYRPDEAVIIAGGSALPGRRLVALTGPLDLELESAMPDVRVALCL
jgi:hypothetical protein